MFRKKRKQITFLCERKQIADLNNGEGNFNIRELKIMSFNTGTIIIIKDYGLIEEGELNLIQ